MARTATARKPTSQPTPAAAVYSRGKSGAAQNDLIELRMQLDQRMGGMRTDRMSWWEHWREIADYLIPRRYKWLITPNQATRGSPINQRIIDNTAGVALRILAAGMMAGITSPGRPWFRMTLDDPDLAKSPRVRVWLDDVAERIRTVLAVSNFYTSLHQMYEDLGAFGTGVLIIYEDFDDVIRCYNSCAGEYFLANSPRMQVDTLYRQFVMTTAQIGREFPIEDTSPTVQEALRNKGAMLSREILVNHAIEPNDKRIAGDLGPKGMPYREVYWEQGTSNEQMLRMRGFEECPFIAPRWSIVGNDAYGRSPGMDALGDIKQLQVEQKRKAQGIDKMVNPPLIAHPNLKNEPASLLPGGITYDSSIGGERAGMRPVYEVQPRLAEMLQDIQDCQGRIRSVFFADLFLLISQLDTVRTATEIDARREEKLIQLGPVLERFENEALDPALQRIFGVMLRRGLLPPRPPELRAAGVRMPKVEYISMLAQAQNAALTTGIERVFTFAGNIAAVKPDVLDKLNEDEGIELYTDKLGVMSKILRSDEEVAAMRVARAKAQQTAQTMQVGAAAVQGAKVLSETDVGGGQNALQQMLGNAPATVQ